MSPVLVLRHTGIHLVMNDEYWKRFKIGKELNDCRGRYDALVARMNKNDASIGLIVELNGVLETSKALRRRLDEPT